MPKSIFSSQIALNKAESLQFSKCQPGNSWYNIRVVVSSNFQWK